MGVPAPAPEMCSSAGRCREPEGVEADLSKQLILPNPSGHAYRRGMNGMQTHRTAFGPRALLSSPEPAKGSGAAVATLRCGARLPGRGQLRGRSWTEPTRVVRRIADGGGRAQAVEARHRQRKRRAASARGGRCHRGAPDRPHQQCRCHRRVLPARVRWPMTHCSACWLRRNAAGCFLCARGNRPSRMSTRHGGAREGASSISRRWRPSSGARAEVDPLRGEQRSRRNPHGRSPTAGGRGGTSGERGGARPHRNAGLHMPPQAHQEPARAPGAGRSDGTRRHARGGRGGGVVARCRPRLSTSPVRSCLIQRRPLVKTARMPADRGREQARVSNARGPVLVPAPESVDSNVRSIGRSRPSPGSHTPSTAPEHQGGDPMTAAETNPEPVPEIALAANRALMIGRAEGSSSRYLMVV